MHIASITDICLKHMRELGFQFDSVDKISNLHDRVELLRMYLSAAIPFLKFEDMDGAIETIRNIDTLD